MAAAATPPMAPASTLKYAGFWIRFVARFIDGLILGIPFYALIAIVGGAAVSSVQVDPNTGAVTGGTAALFGSFALIYLGFFVVTILYYAILWGGGGTLGQRLLGLHVVDANSGGHIGTGRGFLRVLGYFISAAVCSIGLIWAAFDPRKQGWHDKIATTVVTRKA